MLKSSCRESSYEINQFLVVIVGYAALVVEEHRGPVSAVEFFPLGEVFGIRVAGAGKIGPAVAHLGSEFQGLLAAPGHAGVSAGIVEHERYLHTVGAAQDSVKDRGLPAEHIQVHRCPVLAALARSLFQSARAEGEIKVDQVGRLVSGLRFAHEVE